MALSLSIDYKSNKTELCEIGKKYDTDKTSQRNNISESRHCHPYTLFYHSLFQGKRNDPLDIAELGILNGSSLLMWQEYFSNAKIYGFENNLFLIDQFQRNHNNDRISLSEIDVTNKNSISDNFQKMNQTYDIIIEDTTHQFEDQIRVIENVYDFLKPGGVLIIEDIFKSYKEEDYIQRLQPILHHFQDYYFISLDHTNRCSTGWDNDKLFVLVKGGREPIFKNQNKITIITPSYRIDNIKEIKKSIDFNYVNEWIIVYDGTKITENPYLFEKDENSEKIKEYVYKGEGISGNPQRNYALTKINHPSTYLYYLDDDNIIHPHLYKLLDFVEEGKVYSFNQKRESYGLYGNHLEYAAIHAVVDTAMFIIDYSLCKDIQWHVEKYDADAHYVKEFYQLNKDKHIFVNNELCYYNFLATFPKVA
jgi:predicted O-methyltransferase YrrM